MPKLVTIDCDYLHPLFAAAYLRTENGRALFVDNNTSHAVPKLMAALQAERLTPESVDYIIVTHVHLDHAGGTSALLQRCPNAVVLAHPKAARSIIDPARLVASAKQVYGEAEFKKLYGSIEPVDAARVRVMADGEALAFGRSTLRFFYTKGHATHHFCIHDTGLDAVFTGDAFGLKYPALQHDGLFIFPSTSPIDFDPDEARASLDKILATGARRAFLTHFGEVTDLPAAKAQLLEGIAYHEAVLQDAIASELGGAELAAWCAEQLMPFFGARDRRLLSLDIELNGAGIAHVAEKHRS